MYNSIPKELWMLIKDKKIKDRLVEVFDIPWTGIRSIIDQTVLLDGYSDEDLKAITLEKMIAYIGSEETFPRAWEITCMKAKGEVYPPLNLQQETFPMADEPKEVEEIIETNTKKHDSKKSK